MGGLAFSSGDAPLDTPRMPSPIYEYVLDLCCTKLRELFVVVATPIPGPAKKDYGDIDIFLTWERDEIFPSATSTGSESSSLPQNPLDAVSRVLNAKRSINTQPRARTIAIPWPEDLPEEIASSYTEHRSDATKPRYIQVDLHHYASLDQLQWMLFKHAHGDLWNILGSTIRPFGLTVDGMGLYLRIPEIESLNRKQAKILLTEDPDEILDFLGLEQDRAQWEEPFASVDDLFEYAATCRLFRVRPPPGADEENGTTETTKNDDDTPDRIEKPEGGGEVGMARLKSNDRRRMNQRPVFRRWVDEFVPSCRDAGSRFAARPPATRDSVRTEAFARFPGARQAYEERLAGWRRERQRQTLWRDVIKASVPESGNPVDRHWRSNAAGALKKIVLLDDYGLGVRPDASLRDGGSGLYDEERVRRFVVENWEEVGRRAWKENQARFAEKMAVKQGAEHQGDADGRPKDGISSPEELVNPTEE
ncbi:hypothetical protein GGR53DRAFT_394497 [Hypoxylon sp. FL1150]|nr:hypothetical protein GGR53DRAFT_394497 [Hypoxylon sp. FL1150]